MNSDKELAQLARDYINNCSKLFQVEDTYGVGSPQYVDLWLTCEKIYGQMEIVVEKGG